MDIVTNLRTVHEQIRQTENKYQRKPGSVTLVAVSKTHSVDAIDKAIAAGQLVFGESYVQEALPKIAAIAKTRSDIVWHYIGRIQSNKIKYLARNFAWVQSTAKKEHAIQLNKHRPENLPPLNICIEVNLSAEFSKTGVVLSEILSLAQEIKALPRLKLRGLMAIPAPATDFATQFAAFRKLAEVYHDFNSKGFDLDTLSMGMSDDFVAAIAAGSTMVRIGTAIFGVRSDPNN